MDDDDKNEKPLKNKTSVDKKKKECTNLNQKNAEEPTTTKFQANFPETSTKSESSNTLSDTLTTKCVPPSNIENDWKITQLFLAEAECAPKQIFSYGKQEEFSKFIGTYSEQKSELNENFPDGPSCSRIVTKTANEKLETQVTSVIETHESSATNDTKLTEAENIEKSEHEKLRSTKSIFKKEPELEGELTYGTVRPIATEIAIEPNNADPTPASSVRSLGSLVCRICHNSENPERLVSPCLCKGTLSFVHIHCLERWISTSRSTVCELCQFQYNTEQTLRYTCIQSLRMWYSRSMSRRALQEDCQMFSLLTLVAFGIIGTLLVGIQYYFIQGRHWGLSSMWTKGWLLFFLFTTLLVYFINIYMILRSQLAPWYRWWQSARDIKLILENRKPFKILPGRRMQGTQRQSARNLEQQPTSQIHGGRQQQSSMATQRPILPPSTQTSVPTESMPLTTRMQSISKLKISSELTKTAAEIIEIPLEAFDS